MGLFDLPTVARYKHKVLGESQNSYHQRNKREVKVTNLLLVEFLTSFRQLLFQICQKFKQIYRTIICNCTYVGTRDRGLLSTETDKFGFIN